MFNAGKKVLVTGRRQVDRWLLLSSRIFKSRSHYITQVPQWSSLHLDNRGREAALEFYIFTSPS